MYSNIKVIENKDLPELLLNEYEIAADYANSSDQMIIAHICSSCGGIVDPNTITLQILRSTLSGDRSRNRNIRIEENYYA